MSDLGTLFAEDYYGAKWKVDYGKVRAITWSAENSLLQLPGGEFVGATDSLDNYLGEISKAFQIWGDSIKSIRFNQTSSGNLADITIAATDVDGPGGLKGYWNSSWDDNKNIIEGTIMFDGEDINDGWLLTTAMHEIGNILGLGDLPDSSQCKSVQEDPFPEQFDAAELWDYDKYLIDQVYPSLNSFALAQAQTDGPQPESSAETAISPETSQELISQVNVIIGSRKKIN